MDRETLQFSVGYSARLEKMTATLLGRIDRLISVCQFCAGAAVFASVANLPLVGGAVVLLSTIALVYQPALKAGLADVQKKSYEALLSKMAMLSDDELAVAFAQIQANDSSEIGALSRAAECGERIRLGAKPACALSWYEVCVAWIAGDVPDAGEMD